MILWDLTGQQTTMIRKCLDSTALLPPTKEYDQRMRASAMFALQKTSMSTCQFSNIMEIWGNHEEAIYKLNQCCTYSEKVDMANKLPTFSHGWCYTHGQMCPYMVSRLRVQGPPCPDWSPAGLRRGVDGKDFPVLLAGGRKTDSTQTAVAVLENAKKFPLGVIEDVYGKNYSWVYTQQDPALVGFEFISRERTSP